MRSIIKRLSDPLMILRMVRVTGFELSICGFNELYQVLKAAIHSKIVMFFCYSVSSILFHSPWLNGQTNGQKAVPMQMLGTAFLTLKFFFAAVKVLT